MRVYQRDDLSFITLPQGYVNAVGAAPTSAVSDAQATFDLRGRRVTEHHPRRGIYIHQGHKVVVNDSTSQLHTDN